VYLCAYRCVFMSNINVRVKEERLRLGYSQTELGELCGVKLRAQQNYEKGVSKPDAAYLMNANNIGVDLNYVLTGQRQSEERSKADNELRTMAVNDQDDIELSIMVSRICNALQKAKLDVTNQKLIMKLLPIYKQLTNDMPYNSRDGKGKRQFDDMLILVAEQSG
jgi:transcriptional regulator with XRE-family HTH domain